MSAEQPTVDTPEHIAAIGLYVRRQQYVKSECGCACPTCVRLVLQDRAAGPPWWYWRGVAPCRKPAVPPRGDS